MEDKDDARDVDYQIQHHHDGDTMVESNAKHIVPDKASTDQIALQYKNVRASTDTTTKISPGKTHLYHQELTHLMSIGSDGDANANPSSISGELHNMGYHSHLRSTIRLLSTSKVDAPVVEDHHTTSKLVQSMTEEAGSYSHALPKHNLKSTEDALQHLSDKQIRDHFFSIASASNSRMTLAEAATAIATSAQARTELTHQLRSGGLQNHKMAQRLIGAVGNYLTQCTQDCPSVLSTLMEIAESEVPRALASPGFDLICLFVQGVDPHVQEMALVALLQPTCYDHTAALRAIQRCKELRRRYHCWC